MFDQSHSKPPLLQDRQLNQRDPVPSVGKGVATTSTAKAQANTNVREYAVRPDSCNSEL